MLKFYGDPIFPEAVRQINTCMENGQAKHGVLTADHHVGYSMPIGGVIAYKEAVSPSGVGYDIGCGNQAIKLDTKADTIRPYMQEVMDDIVERISFGMGGSIKPKDRHNCPLFDDLKWEYTGLDKVMVHGDNSQTTLKDRARSQLGTVGAGNHYVDVFEDESGWVWIGVHFGSRGFGHNIATGFMNRAKGLDWNAKPRHEDMFAPATVFSTNSHIGDEYMAAMHLAGEYASVGRNLVCAKVAGIIGGLVMKGVQNHHNYTWIEEHFGEKLHVVRKGATPNFPGQQSFIGSSMGESSIIVEGLDTEANKDSLYSLPHGAGRVMGRMQAKGKKNRPGLISQEDMTQWVRGRNIILRGGDVDESPQAYKRLTEVIGHHSESYRLLHELMPMGVAMASSRGRR